jgi:ankyrin repeat protein
MIAAANDHAGVAELLLKSGADAAVRSEDGRTALGIAQAKSNEGLIKLLEEAARHGVAKSG